MHAAPGFTVVDPGGGDSPYLPARVGETPLIEVDGIFAKLECTNPCGSIKDRFACYCLGQARLRGELREGQPIVEATSGNTGIALSYYGRLAGHPVTVVMPEHMTLERKEIMRRLGARLVLCSAEGSFAEAAKIRDEMAAETGAYNPSQFSNPLNPECHELTTGREILRQLGSRRGAKAAFVAGVGTGGTLVGAGRALQGAWAPISIVAVEPAEAAVMTGGPNGPHGIYGIGDGFVPEIASGGDGGLHPMISSVEVVSTAEAMAAAQELSERGLCVGVSSGANLVAARRLQQTHDTVVTIFADGFQKYVSAGLGSGNGGSCIFREVCNRQLGPLCATGD